MKLVVIGNAENKEELLVQGQSETADITWQQEPEMIPGAEAYIDLLFDGSSQRTEKLSKLFPATIVVNAVNMGEAELPGTFIRINGWKTFLKRSLVEASGTNRDIAEKLFAVFNKKIEWTPGNPGFITARVVSMIINEAWLTLEEHVSTKEEIDTAMKLGTNYPYGPFEWGEKIGLHNVCGLLDKLSKNNPRYKPCVLLEKQVLVS